MSRTTVLLTLIMLLLPQHSGAAQTPPSPPSQPATGPGGATYEYEAVNDVHIGSSPLGAWLFWPEREDERVLPVTVFVHGFSAVNPESYLGWIHHIVRRGAIVVFPDYQTGNPIEVAPAEFQANAIAGIRLALAGLTDDRFGPTSTESFAIVGHSLGGVLALNLAAVAGDEGLPVPDVLMPVEPGGCSECGGLSEIIGQPFEDLGNVAAETHMMMVTGDRDTIVGRTAAAIAWERLINVPRNQRDFIELRSDSHGTPQLVADHSAPSTGGESGVTDALDWYGFWKLFDMLTQCAFETIGCDVTHGGSKLQRAMGTWSDGTPVEEALVLDAP